MKKEYLIFVVIIVILCIICIALAFDNHRQRRQLDDASELIEIQHEEIKKLAELEAVSCSVVVNVKNTATFGKITTGDVEMISKQIATTTRRELLDSVCLN